MVKSTTSKHASKDVIRNNQNRIKIKTKSKSKPKSKPKSKQKQKYQGTQKYKDTQKYTYGTSTTAAIPNKSDVIKLLSLNDNHLNTNIPFFCNHNLETKSPHTISLLEQVTHLIAERKQKDTLIEELKRKTSMKLKSKRQSKKAKSHFDYTCKRVAKERLFPLVKWITNKEQLDECKEIGSIGYQFLLELKKEDQVTRHSIIVDGNEKIVWENAKSMVTEGLTQKRNGRQTQIKKAFQGLCTQY